MSSNYLSKVGSSLVKRCETRDPFRIADELGVGVAMALPAVAAVVVLALGVVNAAGERRHAAVRRVSAA